MTAFRRTSRRRSTFVPLSDAPDQPRVAVVARTPRSRTGLTRRAVLWLRFGL